MHLHPDTENHCEEPNLGAVLPKELDQLRREGLTSLLAGHPRQAAIAFTHVVRARPNDVPAFVLHEAAVADLVELHKPDTAFLAATKPVQLSDVPTGHAVYSVASASPSSPISVTQSSVGRFEPPADEPDDATVLDFVGAVNGEPPTLIFPYDDHRIYRFGDHILSFGKGDIGPRTVLDLGAAVVGGPTGHRRSIQDAIVVGKTLLVSLGEPASPEASEIDTGYLMAFDVPSQKLLWASEPFVSNADSFIATGTYVISAYGTKAHGGSVTVSDIQTGKVIQKLALTDIPLRIERSENDVLVYSADPERTVKLTVAPKLVPPAPADLPKEDAQPTGNPRLRCALSRAMDALDRRDGKEAESELSALGPQAGPYASALGAAAEFLQRSAAKDPDVIDLTASAPIALAPPFYGNGSSDTIASLSRKQARKLPRFVKRTTTPRPKGPNGEGVIPLSPGNAPAVSFNVPDSYASLPLTNSFATGDDNLILYGNRYLAVLRGRSTRVVLDLGKIPSISFFGYVAAVRGDTLFVAVAAEGPKTDLGGQKEYVAAYDLKTGTRIWRSAPLVSSAGMLFVGDYIVTARGFGQEPSNINVLAVDTGEVVMHLPLQSAPRNLIFSGGSLVAACADEAVSYDVIL